MRAIRRPKDHLDSLITFRHLFSRPNLEAVAKAVLAAGGGMPSEADVFYTANDGKYTPPPLADRGAPRTDASLSWVT